MRITNRFANILLFISILLTVAISALFYVHHVRAQGIEVSCPSGTVPFPTIGAVINNGTGGSKQWLCLANNGAVSTTAAFSGGSGTTINPTNNVIPVRSNATTFVDSHLTDNGTTVTSTEPIAGVNGTAANPSIQIGSTSVGIENAGSVNNFNIVAGAIEQLDVTNVALETRQPVCDFATATGCFTFSASLISATGTGHPDVGFGTDKGQHFRSQAAQADSWGVTACAASTVTVTFTRAYTSTPAILVFDETTKGGANLTAKSNSAFTISCTGATDVVDYFTGGNPN